MCGTPLEEETPHWSNLPANGEEAVARVPPPSAVHRRARGSARHLQLVSSTLQMFICLSPLDQSLPPVKPMPLHPTSNCQGTMFGGMLTGGYPEEEGPHEEVLDLRVYKSHHPNHQSLGGGHHPQIHPEDTPIPGQLTPPRELTSPPQPPLVLSPTLAITQRVLAAASQPTAGTRPFKAYPKDLGVSSADEGYLRFREEMLSQVRSGKHNPTNQVLRKPGSPNHSESDETKDAAYWERRRKNNEAAKRSRDARRAKEDEIAIRAAFLEQENLKLKYQIAAITEEYNHMRRIFYENRHHQSIQPLV